MRPKEVMLTVLITKDFHKRLKDISDRDDLPMSYIARIAMEKEVSAREEKTA